MDDGLRVMQWLCLPNRFEETELKHLLKVVIEKYADLNDGISSTYTVKWPKNDRTWN